MAGKVLSIEVGYSFTKVCEVDYQAKKTKVYQSFVLPTPEGVLADGTLTVDDDFVAAFKAKLSELKIKTKAAVFTISSSKIATREVRIPYCKENRIGDLVRANLQDYFPIDVSQYMVAHSVLEVEGVSNADTEESGAKKPVGTPTGYKLLLLAAPTQIINSYRLFAGALGLEVKEIDYNGNSIYQVAKEACGEGTQMIVKLDERSSILLVLKNGVIVLNRTIPYGIDESVAALADTSVWGEISSYEDALTLATQNICILPSFQRPAVNKDGNNEAEADSVEVIRDMMAVTSSLTSLVGGISKVVDYYNSRNMDAKIESMHITGVGADFAGISTLLNNELGMEVHGLNHVSGVQSEKALKEGTFGEFAVCIGAAMSPVHFTSEHEEEKTKGAGKGNLDSTHIAVLACIGCILVGLVLVISSLLPYLSAKKEQERYNLIIENLAPVYDVYVQYQNLKSQAEQLAALDKETVNRNEDIVAFIEALEAQMPTTFTLNDFTATTDGINMNVTVATKEEAAAVLDELRKMEMFMNVDTTSLSQLVTEAGESQYSFAVEMFYAPIVEETTEGEE